MRVAVFLLVLLSAQAAGADELSDMSVAREIGQIISTADVCGYDLDKQKVTAFISDRIANMGENARMTFQSAGGAHKFRIQNMSEIERLSACALQKSLAEKYGLTP